MFRDEATCCTTEGSALQIDETNVSVYGLFYIIIKLSYCVYLQLLVFLTQIDTDTD